MKTFDVQLQADSMAKNQSRNEYESIRLIDPTTSDSIVVEFAMERKKYHFEEDVRSKQI